MSIGNDIELINTGGPGTFWFTASSIPTTGQHGTDEVCWNVPPVPGQPLGWFCTVEGTPGTWTPFGTIPISGTGAFAGATVTNGSQSTLGTITVPGATVGMVVDSSFSLTTQGTNLYAYVSAANTVSYAFSNTTGASVTLPAGTVTVKVHA